MTPSEPFVAFAPVAGAFESLGVAYYIGGSIASVHHGVPRSTVDIDVVADLQRDQVDELVAQLGDQYYADAATIKRAAEMRTSFNLIHLPTMFKIDVFIPLDVPFQKSSMTRAQPGRLSDADRSYPIAAAEDVILSDLRYREGGAISERQWRDILSVLHVQNERLDLEYLRNWARQLGLGELLERAVREAGDR